MVSLLESIQRNASAGRQSNLTANWANDCATAFES